jgi:coenzyme F420-reducing hydrogenase beta subunit
VGNRYSFGTGAWSVVNEKIKMKIDEYGEYIPYLENGDYELISEAELKRIKSVSLSLEGSFNEDDISKDLYKNVNGITFDKRLGYYKSLYVGHVIEGKYRENASSGGFGTWIFKELLERNMIDGVIHVKETDEPEKLFKYDISRTVEEIVAGAKTKYYPVEFSEVLKVVKNNPGRYAIIGLPSYIMSIRLLAKADPLIDERILYTVGLICGHQKTTKFAECLAWQCGIKPGNLKKIDFRKKLENLPASSYGIELVGTVEGQEVTIIKRMSELTGSDWGQGFFKCKASDFTDDVMNETADITLGDAWLPEYTNDNKGNNVIIVRNPDIGKIISEGVSDKKIKVDIVDKETIFKSQESHYRHTYDELGYRLFKKDKIGEYYPKKRVHPDKRIPLLRRKAQDFRENIFTQSHIVYQQAVEKDDLSYFISHMQKITKPYDNLYKIVAIRKLGINGISKKIISKVFR